MYVYIYIYFTPISGLHRKMNSVWTGLFITFLIVTKLC